MTFLFFMSGIFFSLDSVSEDLRQYLIYNPVALIIDWYRAVLLHSEILPVFDLGVLTIILLTLLLLSVAFLRAFDRYYPRVLG